MAVYYRNARNHIERIYAMDDGVVHLAILKMENNQNESTIYTVDSLWPMNSTLTLISIIVPSPQKLTIWQSKVIINPTAGKNSIYRTNTIDKLIIWI